MDRKKSVISQETVSIFLKDRGFTIAEVNKPTANGIDIVAIKGNHSFLIEVKSVIKSTRSYRINKPHPKSELIAVVMPSGDIHFEQMKDWEKLCSKDGSQRITKLVEFYSA